MCVCVCVCVCVCALQCRLGLAAARASPELLAEVGASPRAGPWYNTSLRKSHYGHMTACVFPLEGERTHASSIDGHRSTRTRSHIYIDDDALPHKNTMVARIAAVSRVSDAYMYGSCATCVSMCVCMCVKKLRITGLGCEVSVRLIRARGVPSSFIHNVIGTGKWRVMDMSASLPGPGGLPKIVSLGRAGDIEVSAGIGELLHLGGE